MRNLLTSHGYEAWARDLRRPAEGWIKKKGAFSFCARIRCVGLTVHLAGRRRIEGVDVMLTRRCGCSLVNRPCIGKRAGEAIILAVIGGGLRPASAVTTKPRPVQSRRRSKSSTSNHQDRLAARRFVTAE